MSFFKRTRNNLALCGHSLAVVWRDHTLLSFPLISTAAILVTVWMFYLSVGNDKIQMFVNTRVNAVGTQNLNFGYYAVVFVTYLTLWFVTTFCNAALAGAAHISMTERDSKFRDGMQAGVRCLVSLVLWSLFNATIGVLFTVLDQQKTLSRILRNVLPSGWGMMTYFVIPVMVIERKSIFTALGRSGHILADRWGESVTARFGIGWLQLVLSTPALLFLAYEWYAQQLSPFLALLAFSWILFALVLAATAKQVLTVVLYQFAATGSAPTGWNEEALRDTFVGEVQEAAAAPETPAPITSEPGDGTTTDEATGKP